MIQHNIILLLSISVAVNLWQSNIHSSASIRNMVIMLICSYSQVKRA